MNNLLILADIMAAPLVIIICVGISNVISNVKGKPYTFKYRVLQKQIEATKDGENKYYFILKKCKKGGRIRKVKVPYDIYLKYKEQDIY